jgi:hypothetical protein
MDQVRTVLEFLGVASNLKILHIEPDGSVKIAIEVSEKNNDVEKKIKVEFGLSVKALGEIEGKA